MDEIKRLTPAQRARCNRLIRRLCANYDGGNCLPLDDGEGCVCVQMISYSLLSGGRFCPPTRHFTPTFTGSAHGSATGVESPLHPVATGRNTARNAAAPFDASRRRTLPDGGAASNIKRRESLDFQGFWDSKAGAGGRFHPPPPKSISNILQRRKIYEQQTENRGRRDPAVHADEQDDVHRRRPYFAGCQCHQRCQQDRQKLADAVAGVASGAGKLYLGAAYTAMRCALSEP